jgi:hypothetical protein
MPCNASHGVRTHFKRHLARQQLVEAVLYGDCVDAERYIANGRRGGRLEGEELRLALEFFLVNPGGGSLWYQKNLLENR